MPVSRIFSDSTEGAVATAWVVCAYLVALVPFGVLMVIRRAFFAFQDTRTPFWFGLALTLPNLAALSAWIAVAGALALPSLAAAVAAAIGVTVGSAAYFATLAWVAARARPTRSGAPLGHRVNAAALGLVGLVVLARGAWLLA